MIRSVLLISLFLLINLVPVLSQNRNLSPLSEETPLPEWDKTWYLPEGNSFGTDFLALLGLDMNLIYSAYKPVLGNTYTYFSSRIDFLPFSGGFWPYTAEGIPLEGEALFTDPRTSYKQMSSSWEFTLYQGLYRNTQKPLPDYLNHVNYFLSYKGFYDHPDSEGNKDAYLFNTPGQEEPRWLGNILKTGLLYYDVDHNRLINTKKGISSQIQAEWAPREWGNDLIGLTDFTRISTVISGNLPLIEEKDVSLYLFERAGMDRVWGEYLPPSASYGLASLSFNFLRGMVLFNAPWHASHILELRGSFPTLFEPGIMPGFSLFWDSGISPYQKTHSLGGSLIFHMDAASIIPNLTGAILDIQLGGLYSYQKENYMFYFQMVLPQ